MPTSKRRSMGKARVLGAWDVIKNRMVYRVDVVVRGQLVLSSGRTERAALVRMRRHLKKRNIHGVSAPPLQNVGYDLAVRKIVTL